MLISKILHINSIFIYICRFYKIIWLKWLSTKEYDPLLQKLISNTVIMFKKLSHKIIVFSEIGITYSVVTVLMIGIFSYYQYHIILLSYDVLTMCFWKPIINIYNNKSIYWIIKW